MELRRIPIYQSLNRSNLILGGERELTLLSALVSGALVFLGMSPVTTLLGAGVWTLSLFVLRKMAKADPKMSLVYRRHLAYQSAYLAKSRVWRNWPSFWRAP
jgi:type IV secretory pathway TrbD component